MNINNLKLINAKDFNSGKYLVEDKIKKLKYFKKKINNHVVAALPYRIFTHPNDINCKYPRKKIQYLLYSIEKNYINSIISKLKFPLKKDKPKFQDLLETIRIELEKKIGYKLKNSSCINSLGICFGIKNINTTYHLFSVNLTEKRSLNIKTDIEDSRNEILKATLLPKEIFYNENNKNEIEKKSYYFWSDTIKDAVDPLVYTLYYRLQEKLRGKI